MRQRVVYARRMRDAAKRALGNVCRKVRDDAANGRYELVLLNLEVTVILRFAQDTVTITTFPEVLPSELNVVYDLKSCLEPAKETLELSDPNFVGHLVAKLASHGITLPADWDDIDKYRKPPAAPSGPPIFFRKGGAE